MRVYEGVGSVWEVCGKRVGSVWEVGGKCVGVWLGVWKSEARVWSPSPL
jgi:hypothetical protein